MKNGRSHKTPRKESNELTRLKKENKLLKRQNARYKKLLQRLDHERFMNIQEAIDAQKKEENELQKELKAISLEERWKCFDCGKDYLRLVVFNRPDGSFYFRRCPTCGRKTKRKRLIGNIEGNDV